MSGDSGGGTGLPPSLELAWGLRERPAKGPKPGLSLERIVDAAVGVAAAEGLAAVSMGRVAKELGASTMSLYRYVGAKDELFILMLEAALGAPPAPPEPGIGWREALTRWAWAQREVLRRNLWALRIPTAGPPITPNSVAWMDQGLGALAGTGLGEGEKISVILLVNGFVRYEAQLMADLAEANARTGAAPEEVLGQYGRMLGRLADPGRYPAVARMLEAGVMEPPGPPGAPAPDLAPDPDPAPAPDPALDPDFEFVFGLERVLDGVEVLVRKRGAGG